MILEYLGYLGLCAIIGGIIYGAHKLQKHIEEIEYAEREDGSVYKVNKKEEDEL